MVFWVRVSSSDEGASVLRCAGALTPYSIEQVGEHAVLAGPGARVHVIVPRGTSDTTVEWVSERLTRACKRRAEVLVRRGSIPA